MVSDLFTRSIRATTIEVIHDFIKNNSSDNTANRNDLKENNEGCNPIQDKKIGKKRQRLTIT